MIPRLSLLLVALLPLACSGGVLVGPPDDAGAPDALEAPLDAGRDAPIDVVDAAPCVSCELEGGLYPINCIVDPPSPRCDPEHAEQDQCGAGKSCHQPCCDENGCLGWICACVGEACTP